MEWREHLNQGQVIPACPLTLHEDGRWSEAHQRAVLRYYLAAGAGGIAVGVHSTQFAIREPQHGLLKPVLQLAAETVTQELPAGQPFVRVAGICGRTEQAVAEAEFARDIGYDAGLVSLMAWGDAAEETLIEHCRQVASVLPIIGFYLQTAVGGRVFSYRFWRSLLELDSLVAIKIAPFNRYFTGDVVRATIDAGRDDVALYTGNDDHIIADLLTPYRFSEKTRFLVGGLLGQWGVWTQCAVQTLQAIRDVRGRQTLDVQWLQRDVELTDANAAIFDVAHHFAGCIPGINEVLRRGGLTPSNRCLDPNERLSEGQNAEIDRVLAAYPHLTDDAFVREHLDQWLR